MSTQVEAPVPQPSEEKKVADVVAKSSDDSKKTAVMTYLFYGMCVVAVVLLCYYAYYRFVENSVTEPYIRGQQQERDDPVMDFNLHEAIHDLKKSQQQILRGLSANVGI